MVLTAILLPFYIVGAVVAIFPGRRRLLRVVSFAMAYLWTDVGMLFGCWWLWFRQPLPSRDETVWRERHTALLRQALRVLAKASRSMVGFRVVIDAGPLPVPHRPLMILGRHAGPGDSFTLVNLILTTFRRRPKVVLKAAMQWDPGIDLLLNRLDCYFLPSTTGAGDDRVAHVARLAASLEDDEALLIFPEGGNWTPKRHERAVRYLLRTGQYERAKEAEDEEHVLPPRPGGVVAALSARPTSTSWSSPTPVSTYSCPHSTSGRRSRSSTSRCPSIGGSPRPARSRPTARGSSPGSTTSGVRSMPGSRPSWRVRPRSRRRPRRSEDISGSECSRSSPQRWVLVAPR